MEKGGDHATQGGHDGEEAHDPENAERAEDGPGSGSGDERDGHNEEIKDVPTAFPEGEAVGEEPDGDFCAEDDEAELV